MYSEFRTNLMITILKNNIVNIHISNGEIIVIGLGGYDKNQFQCRELGFTINKEGTYNWYSYSSIIKMEIY